MLKIKNKFIKKKSKKKGKFEMIKGNLLISNTSRGHTNITKTETSFFS